jgi:8-oxo-dGTP pyrophosphatase MutT (NUDIX family)
MNNATDYKIIFKGLFTEADFHFEVLPGKREFKPETRKLINEAWQDARLNPDLNIYNGPVISLISIAQTHCKENDREQIYLKVQETDYKSFFGTNVCNPRSIPKPELSNALAACAVVETKEGSVFVGLRNPKLAETSGLWHVPGGTFDEVINPIALMRRELKEELNIEDNDIQFAVCLGFAENLLMKKPEFLCYFHLKLDESQLSYIMPDAKDKEEHTEHVFVPMEELQDFVDVHPFAPIGKACIMRYLEFIEALEDSSFEEE